MRPTDQPHWGGVFAFGTTDAPEDAIRIAQLDERYFRLESRVEYLGLTGLEGTLHPNVIRELRVVEVGQLLRTDLASVPGPLRWFVNSYGSHTPAALIHDRLIPVEDNEDGLTDIYADDYFRHMLHATGEPWIRRWLMWTAVAYRTRLATRRASMVLWTLSAIVGMIIFIVGLATSNLWMVGVASVAPVLASALWSGQYRAGLMAAVSALFIVPPTVAAALGYGAYWSCERIAGALAPGRSPQS